MGKTVEIRLPIEPFSQSPRTNWVYLPDGYEKSRKPYPVLYMFDGHNLFYDEVATYGKSWGIKDYLDGEHLPLIVVGEDCNHIGNGRMDEYCPLKPRKIRGWEDTKPQGDITAEWFVHTLKPAIEKEFHVHTERKYTGIGGSSMGGLMSDYMACLYNDVYSRFASISPATEFCYRGCMKLIQKSSFQPHTRLYRSFGSDEVKTRKTEMRMISALMDLSNAFTDQGCEVHNRIIVNGKHDEATWESIVPEFLHYLFPEIYAR
jgi:predicted alpha/beta superfamily hydrolase